MEEIYSKLNRFHYSNNETTVQITETAFFFVVVVFVRYLGCKGKSPREKKAIKQYEIPFVVSVYKVVR